MFVALGPMWDFKAQIWNGAELLTARHLRSLGSLLFPAVVHLAKWYWLYLCTVPIPRVVLHFPEQTNYRVSLQFLLLSVKLLVPTDISQGLVTIYSSRYLVFHLLASFFTC